MLITPTQIQATLDRQQDLLAEVIRDRRISAVVQPGTCGRRGLGRRVRAGLRQAVASLVALAVIG